MNQRAFSFFLALFVICAHVVGMAAQDKTTSIGPQSSLEQNFEYWTTERVRKAKPLPWYDENADASAKYRRFEQEVEGPEGSIPGGLPDGEKSSNLLKNEPGFSIGDNTGESMIDQYYEPIDETYDGAVLGSQDIFDDTKVNTRVPLWRYLPWRAIGKLFFKTPAGRDSYCTASVISGNDIIVTAAHCVYDRNTRKWMSNFEFHPAYQSGNSPLGKFGWTRARVLTDWISVGGRQNDVALIKLSGSVSATTSWLGRSWNYPEIQHHHSFGYPGNIGGGEILVQCTSESFPNCGDSLVYGTGCSMTWGSSGGPWIRQFEYMAGGANNYVNGVVSGYDPCTGTLGGSFNGARFTNNNIVVLCTAEGC